MIFAANGRRIRPRFHYATPWNVKPWVAYRCHARCACLSDGRHGHPLTHRSSPAGGDGGGLRFLADIAENRADDGADLNPRALSRTGLTHHSAAFCDALRSRQAAGQYAQPFLPVRPAALIATRGITLAWGTQDLTRDATHATHSPGGLGRNATQPHTLRRKATHRHATNATGHSTQNRRRHAQNSGDATRVSTHPTHRTRTPTNAHRTQTHATTLRTWNRQTRHGPIRSHLDLATQDRQSCRGKRSTHKPNDHSSCALWTLNVHSAFRTGPN